MSDRSTIRSVAGHLALATQPLIAGFRDAESFRVLMLRLGWDVQSLPPSYLAVADAAAQLVDAAKSLADDAGLDESLALARSAGDLYRAVSALTAVPPGMDPAGLATLARSLFELLLVDYLNLQLPRLGSTLELLGVIRYETVAAAGTRPAFTRTRFEWEALPKVLTDPTTIPEVVLGWGTPQFDFARAAVLFGELGYALNLATAIERMDADFANAVQSQATGTPAAQLLQALRLAFFDVAVAGQVHDIGLLVTELPAEGGALPGVLILPLVPDHIAVEIPIDSRWTFKLRAGTDLAQQLGVVFRPGDLSVRFPFAPGRPPPSAGFGVTLSFTPAAPVLLRGSPGGNRVELAGLDLTLALDVRGGDLELTAAVAPRGLVVVVTGRGLDGFLGNLLGDADSRVELPIGVSWSSRTGLDFRGGAGFELSANPHLELGPVRFDRVDLAAKFVAGAGVTPELDLRGGVTFSGSLGPVAFAVDRIGVHLPVRFEAGNAGPFDVGFGLHGPGGIALSVSSGPVTGGGFLFFDPDKQQYAGGLRLEFEKLTLNAIGLLTTRMPDGSDGFSLLVIVQASGFTPIQLGFGFTLNGVGGLLGINRTVSVDALRAGLKNRTLDAILFSPDDPTPRAPQIVSTLQTVFPPAANQYVFGPMALIGWGTPTLLTIEIALILELPSPIRLIVLGRVRAALPNPDQRIVNINLDVVGVIDFDKRELSVDATLYDSTVGPYALSGDMAARANWGSNPDFAMSVGGFHPAFKPPAGFPTLRRLTLALSTGDNPRLRMETYFALTSNTVQVGARLDLAVRAAGFSIEGGLAFDTLIQFDPFRLLAEIRAHLALKRGGTTLLGLDIDVHLSGPAPWVIWGKARIKLFIFTISIPFRAQFGRDEDIPAIERHEVWPVLRDSLRADANWTAQLPNDRSRLVVLSEGAGSGTDLLAHPLGTLGVSQNLVPLERTLGLFGSVPPRDFDRFAITGASGLHVDGRQTQYFAPAQFRQMSDEEKLASPPFERMVSGVRLGPEGGSAIGFVQETPLDYEQVIILDLEQPAGERPAGSYTPAVPTVAALAEFGPAGSADLRTTGRARFGPAEPGPRVADPVYALVSKDQLAATQALADDGLDGTFTAAAERLRSRADRNELQIVRIEELELA